jgi:hypothetical protein
MVLLGPLRRGAPRWRSSNGACAEKKQRLARASGSRTGVQRGLRRRPQRAHPSFGIGRAGSPRITRFVPTTPFGGGGPWPPPRADGVLSSRGLTRLHLTSWCAATSACARGGCLPREGSEAGLESALMRLGCAGPNAPSESGLEYLSAGYAARWSPRPSNQRRAGTGARTRGAPPPTSRGRKSRTTGGAPRRAATEPRKQRSALCDPLFVGPWRWLGRARLAYEAGQDERAAGAEDPGLDQSAQARGRAPAWTGASTSRPGRQPQERAHSAAAWHAWATRGDPRAGGKNCQSRALDRLPPEARCSRRPTEREHVAAQNRTAATPAPAAAPGPRAR